MLRNNYQDVHMDLLNPKILPNQSLTVDALYKIDPNLNERVVYGATETAKTFQALLFAHTLCLTKPNFQCVVLRKNQTTVYPSILQSLKQHILPHGLYDHPDSPVKPHGGQNKPQWLDYPHNGARMWFGGEDDKSGKILGTEWDLALYSQCEYADPTFWQQLSGRCTGRAGNWTYNGQRYALLLGECNPSSRSHFLLNREQNGKLDMIKFVHKDNPLLFYDGEWTEYGLRTDERLRSIYTGTTYERLYLGNWSTSEGIVFPEFDPNVHIVKEQQILDEIEHNWVWTCAADHGHRHAFVWQLYCGPPDRSKLYLFKEIFKTGLDVDAMKYEVNKMLRDAMEPHGRRPEELFWTVADYRPEINLTISRNLGFDVEPADREVIPGIERLRQGLHQRKIFFNESSLAHTEDQSLVERGKPCRTVQEFEIYRYKPDAKMNGTIEDEKPDKSLDADNGIDPLRYEYFKWSEEMVERAVVSRVLPPPSWQVHMLVNRYGNPLGESYPIERKVISSHVPRKTDARQTVDRDGFTRSTGTIISPVSHLSWNLNEFNDENIVNLPASDVLNRLADQHPDIGRAIWEIHNNCVTPWTWTARMPNGKEDPIGTGILMEAADYLESVINEPIEVKLGQLIDSAFLKDHFFTETVFEREEFLNINVIDPYTARWEEREDPERGQYYQLGQEQMGKFIELTSEFIRFTPLMPQVGKPYGRSVMGASIFPMIFLLNLIKSAKKVIDTQAWPNRLATINRETLFKSGLKPQEIENLMTKLEKQVCEDMKASGKGSQFVWDAAVDVQLIGGMNRVNLDAIPMMEKILERWIIRALKQYPITFAIDSGNALSTNAEQQSEQFATAIDSLLRKLEALFRYHGNHILKHRLGGSYQGLASFELKRNNAVVRKFRTEAYAQLMTPFIQLHAAGVYTDEELRRLSIRPDLVDNMDDIITEKMPQELKDRNEERNMGPQEPEVPEDDVDVEEDDDEE